MINENDEIWNLKHIDQKYLLDLLYFSYGIDNLSLSLLPNPIYFISIESIIN